MLFQVQKSKTIELHKLHDDVLSFFKEAIDSKKFDEALFSKELWNVLKRSYKLRDSFEDIYKSLPKTAKARQKVYNFLYSYDDIEALCKYPKLKVHLSGKVYLNVISKVMPVYQGMWDLVGSLKEIAKQYGSIHDHYREFYDLNCTPSNICPFCGIEKYVYPQLGRSDYDHYLCKSVYAQSAINFKNLIPMPDRCNKAPNKGSQDMLFNKLQKRPRKAHYPFNKVPALIVKLNCFHLFELVEEWSVSVARVGRQSEEFRTWKEVFRIEERWAVEIAENKSNWLNNFYNFSRSDVPSNLTQLRRSISKYVSYLRQQAKQPAWFLEIEFWKYLSSLDASNGKLLLGHLTAQLAYRKAA